MALLRNGCLVSSCPWMVILLPRLLSLPCAECSSVPWREISTRADVHAFVFAPEVREASARHPQRLDLQRSDLRALRRRGRRSIRHGRCGVLLTHEVGPAHPEPCLACERPRLGLLGENGSLAIALRAEV